MRYIQKFSPIGILILLASFGACSQEQSGSEQSMEATSAAFTLPDDPNDEDGYSPLKRFEAMNIPADNPITLAKASLGRQLYYDYRLSGDGSRSCYSCHVVEHGLTDGMPVAIGAHEKKLTRSSPTMWNVGYHENWYWDGRASTLEGQAKAAWTGANMGAQKADSVVAVINALDGYRNQFQDVFGEDATTDNIPKALATYMRTIISRDTPWDRWQKGDSTAVNEAAKRGAKVFEKSNCDACHSGVLFTDLQFHNAGIGMNVEDYDVGRFKVTGDDQNRGAFKTPTLRDISKSGPYFHNGQASTLIEAVKIMSGGGIANPYLDELLEPHELTDQDLADLLEFLGTLSQDSKLGEIPELPQ
jgi:cytochrome c peroxidase